MGKPWKTTRICNSQLMFVMAYMYKLECTINHHSRPYYEIQRLLLIIPTMKTQRDLTHPAHRTERFQRRRKAVDRHSAQTNRWNGGIQQPKKPLAVSVCFCCGQLLFNKSSTALCYGRKSTDLAFCNVFQVPNSITTTPQNSYVPVATNSWVRQLGDQEHSWTQLNKLENWVLSCFCHSLLQPLPWLSESLQDHRIIND